MLSSPTSKIVVQRNWFWLGIPSSNSKTTITFPDCTSVGAQPIIIFKDTREDQNVLKLELVADIAGLFHWEGWHQEGFGSLGVQRNACLPGSSIRHTANLKL